MALSEKDIAILVQSTANVTAQLCKGDDTPVEEFFEIHESVFRHSLGMISAYGNVTEPETRLAPVASEPCLHPSGLVAAAEKRSDRSPDWKCGGCGSVRWGKGAWKAPRG